VLEKREDRSGDGKPDLVVHFANGRIASLEQDTKGKGCPDLKQRYDAAGRVQAEYKDENGDCNTDIWSYYEGERLVRLGQDTKGRGRPDVLNHVDANGVVTVQELISGDGKVPNQKLFLAPDGSVTGQCFLDEKGARLNARGVIQGGVMTELLVDTTGNGVADTREVYQGETRVRVEVDTNGDGKVDIVQSTGPGGVSRQDEDTDFDGVLDRRFDGDALVRLPAGTKIGGEDFGKLGCGSFHGFWRKR
jgi:hypothetical protein